MKAPNGIELSTEEKRKFFQYCLDVYTLPVKQLKQMYTIKGYTTFEYLKECGFCLLYYSYFGERGTSLIDDIPEFKKYKPKVFYTFEGEKTTKDNQLWFPHNQHEERIKILREILNEMKSKENIKSINLKFFIP